MASDNEAAVQTGTVAKVADLPDLGEMEVAAIEEVTEPDTSGVAEAAQAEATQEPRQISYQLADLEPLKLMLPPVLMASAVGRGAVLRGDVNKALRFVEALMGADQYDLVMDYWDDAKLDTGDEDKFGDAVERLLTEVMNAYGFEQPGES